MMNTNEERREAEAQYQRRMTEIRREYWLEESVAWFFNALGKFLFNVFGGIIGLAFGLIVLAVLIAIPVAIVRFAFGI